MTTDNSGATVGQSGWTRFFYAAAIFNFLIGLAAMLVPQSTLDGRMIGLFVFAFGLIYWIVARDAKRYASVLWAGVISKLGVVGLLGPRSLQGEMDPLVLGMLAGDLIFALGFLIFLFNREEE